MTLHWIEKCKHGHVHAQCRCAVNDKEVRIVPCGSECRHPTTEMLDELAKIPSTEAAWLIEHATTPMWLGVCNGTLRWGSADDAIRFVRKMDAVNALHVLQLPRFGFSNALRNAKVTEHLWGE